MTKYYKLLKDLPTFKKGDLFRLSDEGSLFLVDPNPPHWLDTRIAYSHITLEHFPNILKDWFEEVEDPNGRWGPKRGEQYYFIGGQGETDRFTWRDDDCDLGAKEIGNVFHTQEEAEKALEWLKVRKVLFDDAKGFRPNWKDTQERKWLVIWDWWEGIRGLFTDDEASEICGPGPYFATREDAEASIKAHEKEWKIYLGVEE